MFQFKFQTKFDLERVMKEGPWTFDNQALMLRKQQKGMTENNVKFNSMSLWVQIWGVTFDMFSLKVATEVGSKMGVVEEVEKRQKQEAQSIFMQVIVSIPTSKPFRRGSYIAGLDGGCTWVTFKYERLPMFCHYCDLLGHDIRHCASHYAMLKNGKEVVCQYGDWLKALGARNGSLSKRKPNQSAPTDEAVKEMKKGTGSPTPPYSLVAAVVANSTNPTEGVSHEKGKCVNQGTVTNLQVVTNLRE